MIGLEVVHVRPEKPNRYPPLFFIHGEFHAAWCWKEHFLPFFLERGFECLALSLRGHGRSRLVDLQKVRFRDYVADVTQVTQLASRLPILVGHSMGAVVAQGYAQYHHVAGLALLAPRCAFKAKHRFQPFWHFVKHHFRSYLEMQFLKRPHALVQTPERTKEAFFSEDMPQDKIEEYAQLFQDESIPVLFQIQRRNLFHHPPRKGVPCLVVGAGNDTLVHPSDIDLLASLHQATKEVIPNLAHDVMLDTRWHLAAESLLSWIKKTFEEKGSKPKDPPPLYRY